MPYHWNPDTKRSEWQRYWEGTDYGPEPGTGPNNPAPTKPPGWGSQEFIDAIPYPEGATVDYNQPAQPPTTTTTPTGRWDPALKQQMDAIFARYGRVPRDDEYDQWIGPNGYIMRDDINGSGQVLPAWSGGDIDPYWQYRMGLHATGDYWGNGTTPSDANSSRAQPPDATSAQSGIQYSSITPTPTPAPYTPQADADRQMAEVVRQRILQLLNTPQTVDPQSLRDSPEMQAVYLAAQRGQERERAAMAERAAAGGWSGSGALEGGLAGLREKQGETEMQMMSQLATTYMERNREDLKRGIEFALNQGQFDQAQALQRELAALDAAIEREKIGANLELGRGDLDLRRYLGDISSAYDFANLDFLKNKDILDRGQVPQL